MLRKFWALLASLSTALVVLPLTAAQAAVVGSAALTSGTSVVPIASRTFTFSVTNSGELLGDSVNWVRFVLPSDEAGVVQNDKPITPPAGWTATREGAATEDVQSVTFRATGTSVLRPGASTSFSFPAKVSRPVSSDRSGAFTVAASSDSGRTTKSLNPTGNGTLGTVVKVLELVTSGDFAPRPTNVDADDAVTDYTGTGGQAIGWTYRVINHAQNALTITGALRSDGGDSIGAATSVPTSAALNGAEPAEDPSKDSFVDLTHRVTLAAASSNDRVSQFTSSAVSGSSTSNELTRGFTVQVPVNLVLTDLQPERVRTKDAIEVEFSALATKTGSSALTITDGRLVLADVTTPFKTLPLTLPAGPSTQRVTFKATRLDTVTLAAVLRELTVDGVVVLAKAGTQTPASLDGNGFDSLGAKDVLNGSLLVDNLGPDLSVSALLPVDPDSTAVAPDNRQLAAKNGDEVTVSGTVVGAPADVDPAVGSLRDPADGLKVEIVALPSGQRTTVPVTVTRNEAQNRYEFSGSARPVFTDASGAVLKTGTFTVVASLADKAGNPGGATSPSFTIDNVVPDLLSPGFTTTTRSILVEFADTELGFVRGGCDPGHYRINGVPGLVERVEFQGTQATEGNGTACPLKGLAPGNSGKRVLILKQEMAEDATPQVTYEPVSRGLGGDPVRDGAINDALREVIDTVRKIAPLAPEITRVTRNQGAEVATLVKDADGKRSYYTRFPGTPADGNQENEDLEVTFLGSRNGYTVQVLDQAGVVIPGATKQVTGPATPLDSGAQTIRIPIGDAATTVDATRFPRSLRFVTSNGRTNLLGAVTSFDAVLDKKLPTLAAVSGTGTDVTVGFSEVIQSGTDFASDWFGYITTATGARRNYTAESVTVVDAQTRRLSVPFPAGTSAAGAEYRFASGADGGQVYLDRAGNSLGNQSKGKTA